jgi:REP-associated tyrosine transposase
LILPGLNPVEIQSNSKPTKMSKTNLYYHVLFTTKRQKDILSPEKSLKIIQHIKSYAITNAIKIKSINATSNHMHVLLQLHSTQNLAYSMHLLKGESSSWINSNKLMENHFAWQERYRATTVSLNDVRKVKKFINFQSQYHSAISLRQEMHDLLSGAYMKFIFS